jgi:hypothetical protein
MALLDGGMLKRQKSWVKVSIHLLVDFVSVPYAILNCTNILVHTKNDTARFRSRIGEV